MMVTKRCQSCDAPIVWLRTRHGKPMPVDASTAEADPAGRPPIFDETVHRSHFATCPESDDWRRRGRR